MDKYLVELTEKEAKDIGFRRHLKAKGNKPLAIVIILMQIALVCGVSIRQDVVALVLFLLFMSSALIYAWIINKKCEKAGREFLNRIKDNNEQA